MERLPIAVCVPHSGTRIPEEVAGLCALSADQLTSGCETWLAELCGPLIDCVEVFATTKIARTIVDLDRDPGDRGPDGVIKTHTPSAVPVYRSFPPERVVAALLARYHHSFHEQLARRAERAMIGLDWHASTRNGKRSPSDDAPPIVGLHASEQVPRPWVRALAWAFESTFDVEPTIRWRDAPGYIARSAPGDIPWVRIDLMLSEPGGLDVETVRRTLVRFNWRVNNRRGRSHPD